MQEKQKESSTGKIGGRLSPIARGRYISDFYRTTEQIAYHCDVRDSCTDTDSKAREQRIINSCVKHLSELEKKLGWR